jgi:hypothetical protein
MDAPMGVSTAKDINIPTRKLVNDTATATIIVEK